MRKIEKRLSVKSVLQMLLCCSTLIICVEGALAVSQENTVILEKGVTLQLPRGWGHLPEQVLKKMSENMKQLRADYPVPSFDFGFHQEDPETPHLYPYILVQIQHIGRVSEKDLLKAKQVKRAADKAGAQFEKDFSSFLSSLSAGDVLYEKENNILWTRYTGTLSGVGEIKSLTGTILIKDGLIHIHCYSKGKEFSSYGPIFEKIIRSVLIKPELSYR